MNFFYKGEALLDEDEALLKSETLVIKESSVK